MIIPLIGRAQVGGQLNYQALQLSSNPRTAALSGSAVSLSDGDISQFFENPAVLDSVNGKHLFFHINPYFSDVVSYSFAYGFNIKNLENFAAGLHYIDLGSFERTDETGQVIGSFSAQDYVLSVGKAHQLGPFTLGANVKLIHSSIDSYGSSALGFDVGGLFRVNKNWTWGLTFQNIGFQLAKSSAVSAPELPFDVVIGTSFKPEYMPIRFTLTSMDLVNNLDLSESTTGRSTGTIDQVLKRIHLGAEVLISRNFQLLFGYNHKRKQELRLETIGGGAGFSYGFMVRVKNIQLRFSRATYHTAGGSSFISLQTNLRDFKRIL